MKVSEIFLSSMVNDDTEVAIIYGDAKKSGNWYTIIYGDANKSGNWYQDKIIEFSECEVSKLLYDKESNRVAIEVEL